MLLSVSVASAALLPLALTATPQSGAGTSFQRVTVSIENVAPRQGNFQTPFWVGLHDGSFDLYDRGVPAGGPGSPLGDDSLERIAEDGTIGPLSSNFAAAQTAGTDATLFGPAGPVAPGQIAVGSFLVDPMSPSTRYLSYVAMVLPSNDAFVANGNPLAHPIFDQNGAFVFEPFFSVEALDAGTEVNDELPMNTAFFGQMAPDTGTPEGGVVESHPGFNAPGTGGIVDDFRFQESTFPMSGYSFVRVTVRAADAIVDDRDYASLVLDAGTGTPASGRTALLVRQGGTELEFAAAFSGLENVVAIELRAGAPGVDGPVVATLVERAPGSGAFGDGVERLTIGAADLEGPLAGFPLDALVAAAEANEIYVLVRTDDGLPGDDTGPGDFVSGELRGQLARQ
ncbi:MAG: spondin domain-containing protein [Planctomycetota bacterium]